MKRTTAILIVIAFSTLRSVTASNIARLPIDELQTRSQFVIVGTVTNVTTWVDDDQFDIVKVKVASVLEGKTAEKEFQVSLRCRGQKGFDPVMKGGQHAVFFLNGLKNGKATLAYFGSIAVIPNHNFRLRTSNQAIDSDKKAPAMNEPIEATLEIKGDQESASPATNAPAPQVDLAGVVAAFSSGEDSDVRRVTTERGYSSLSPWKIGTPERRRQFGKRLAVLLQSGDFRLRTERNQMVLSHGPEIKAYHWHFVKKQNQWQLDYFTGGD